MRRPALIALAALVAAIACGVDRYPCDDPGLQNPDPDAASGYAEPDCVTTNGN